MEERSISRQIDRNKDLEMVSFSWIGGRNEQQDALAFELGADFSYAVVCDGMGGHESGGLASRTAVSKIQKVFEQGFSFSRAQEILREAAAKIDLEIAALSHDNGEPMQCGTTLSLVVIQEKQMYWASVGDSRIYAFRKGQLVQVSTDHTFAYFAKEKIDEGVDVERGPFPEEGLVSFLGRGGLPFVDSNYAPFALKEGDKILVASDGLYKSLPDQEICECLGEVPDIMNAAERLMRKTEMRAAENSLRQDNTSFILIKVL